MEKAVIEATGIRPEAVESIIELAKKYDHFCASLDNLGNIYRYSESYDTVVLTGLLGLYEVCFEQFWL